MAILKLGRWRGARCAPRGALGAFARDMVCDFADERMAGLAFGDASRPVDLIFLHANGLNARAYSEVLEPLGERFRVLALDLRGHGRSALPTRGFGYASWGVHRDDLIGLIERQCSHTVSLAGHSLGATTALLAAGKRPDLVAGLALIEPVMMPDIVNGLALLPGAPLVTRLLFPIARQARRRRAHFESRAAAKALLSKRGIFRSFSERALDDFLADGLIETDDGGVRLACAPAFEAATYSALRNDPWRALARARGPIAVLRAQNGSTVHETAAARLARMRADVRVAVLAGAGHMLPFERPERARSLIETVVFGAQSDLRRAGVG